MPDTTIQTEVKIENIEGNLISYPIAGNIKVKGNLLGASNREVQLTAEDTSNLFKFKHWIVETTPISRTRVPVGGFTTTIEEMCSGEKSSTLLSNELFTDDTFFYTEQTGPDTARLGFYGAGQNTYYIQTAQGKSGPFACFPNSTPPTQPTPNQAPQGGGDDVI